MTISIICVLGRNRAIGRGGRLPWHIPEDLKRFKQLTMGHVIVMGRKTLDSIGRLLPGRTHVVITRDPGFQREGCVAAHTVEAALAQAARLDAESFRTGEVFVIGGGQVYEQVLPRADRLYLTLVDDAPADADVFFPDYGAFQRVVREEPVAWGGHRCVFRVLER